MREILLENTCDPDWRDACFDVSAPMCAQGKLHTDRETSLYVLPRAGSAGAPAVGVHARGRGPGDSLSLPYFAVIDVAEALERVEALGGSVVHPGERWAICRDSEGSPFGLAADTLT